MLLLFWPSACLMSALASCQNRRVCDHPRWQGGVAVLVVPAK